jgi:hypothetical protein
MLAGVAMKNFKLYYTVDEFKFQQIYKKWWIFISKHFAKNDFIMNISE